MRAVCGNASVARAVPWLLHVWEDRNHVMARAGAGHQLDCEPNCTRLPNMQQHIAAFLIGRGDYAWLGYDWAGGAGARGPPLNREGCTHFW